MCCRNTFRSFKKKAESVKRSRKFAYLSAMSKPNPKFGFREGKKTVRHPLAELSHQSRILLLLAFYTRPERTTRILQHLSTVAIDWHVICGGQSVAVAKESNVSTNTTPKSKALSYRDITISVFTHPDEPETIRNHCLRYPEYWDKKVNNHVDNLKKLFRDAQRDLNASGADGIIGGGLTHKQFLDLFDLWAGNLSFRPKTANTTPGQPLTEQAASVLFPNAHSTRSSGPSVNPSAAASSISIDSFTSSQTPSYPTPPISQHHLTSSGDSSRRSSLQSLAFQMAGISITTPHPTGISSAPPDVSAQANRSSTSVTSRKSSRRRLSTAASSTVGQSSGEASTSKRPQLEDSPAVRAVLHDTNDTLAIKCEREHTRHMAKSAETTLVNGGASLEGVDVNWLLVPPVAVPAVALPAPAPDPASIYAPLPPSPPAPIHAPLPLSPLPSFTPAPIHAPLLPPTPALISSFQGFAYVTPTADMSRGWVAATPGSSGAQAWTTPQQLLAWPISPRMSQASPSIYYAPMPPAIYQPVPAYPGQNHASDVIAASSSADTSNSAHAYTAENVNAYTANAYAAQNVNALYAAQNINTSYAAQNVNASYAAQNVNASTAQNVNAYTAQNTENTNAYNAENVNLYAARGIDAHTIGGVDKHAGGGVDAHAVGGVDVHTVRGVNVHTVEDFVHTRFV
ncbi:hypothetical protein OBBRIDRAFT_803221 [Obba rivulosa]|uniref:Uncharacterized protein n=1 Tax=Obba rivulosa TaxID=1052685 RepID=A0A8E2AVY0_9APHY|nr:hypothetical protein OBBRIDRAFT_803221 [Obba rivulosa]